MTGLVDLSRVVVVCLVVFVVGCNDETDVAIIAGEFSLAAEFQERGLNVTVFEMDEVQKATASSAGPDNVLAVRYAQAINSMAAGTVILNYGGGYEDVVASLRKYSGRKIYCAGAKYWNVEIPEGCIETRSIFSALSDVAPVSLDDWKNNVRNTPLPRASHFYVVFVTSPEKLDNGAELIARTREGSFLVVDATELPNETLSLYCKETFYDCTFNVNGWVFAKIEYNGKGDIYGEELASYYMRDREDRPDCSADMWIYTTYPYFNGGDYPDYLVPEEKGCWSGPTKVVDGVVYIDFDALDD